MEGNEFQKKYRQGSGVSLHIFIKKCAYFKNNPEQERT